MWHGEEVGDRWKLFMVRNSVSVTNVVHLMQKSLLF